MLRSRGFLVVAAVCLSVGKSNIASPQDYPYKPIRLVSGSAGGGNDFAARLIAQGISGPLGQQVVVDNRSVDSPGELVLHARADGYTLLMAGSSHWLAPYLTEKAPYDPIKDYAPITLAVSSPNLIVVHPAVGVTGIKELIALAKAKPGVLNYASGTTGSTNHLSAELFKAMAGVNIVRITYKGSSQALIDVLAGRVQMMFVNSAAVMQYVKADKLKALAVTSAAPSELVPGLPTVAASGVPGYVAVTMYCAFAPAGTPAAIIGRLNQEMVRVLQRPDVKEKFFNTGVEAVGSTPAQTLAAVKAEMTSMGKLIKDAGIRDE